MINLSIPGQMSEGELKAIETLAARVPTDGVVVELGSLFGRSSYAWATSVPSSASVYCVDPWIRRQWMVDRVETKTPNCPTFSFEAFQSYVGHLPNIIPIKGHSPQDLQDWDKKVDVVFDDSVHQNPYFKSNLNFWRRHVRPGGILCGHDYCDVWPDVRKEVDALGRKWRTNVNVVECFWSIEVPERQGWRRRFFNL